MIDRNEKYYDAKDSKLDEFVFEHEDLILENPTIDLKPKFDLSSKLNFKSPLEYVNKSLISSKTEHDSIIKATKISQMLSNDIDLHSSAFDKAMDLNKLSKIVSKNINLISKISTYTSLMDRGYINSAADKAIKITKLSDKMESMNYTSILLNQADNYNYYADFSSKLSRKLDFTMPNIRLESSIKIKDSIIDTLETQPMEIDIDFNKLNSSLDKINIHFSKPSEVTGFILENTDNARPLTPEEAENIDSLAEVKNDNELLEIYDIGIKEYRNNYELLISYICLFITIVLSFSDEIVRGILFAKTADEFLNPAFKDLQKKTNKLLESKNTKQSQIDIKESKDIENERQINE